VQGAVHAAPSGAPSLAGVQKNELIVWVWLSPLQRSIYRSFVNDTAVKDMLMSVRSPLAALTVLKTLCDHPRLLMGGTEALHQAHERANAQPGAEGDENTPSSAHGDGSDSDADSGSGSDDDATSRSASGSSSGSVPVPVTRVAMHKAMLQSLVTTTDAPDEMDYDKEYWAYKESQQYKTLVAQGNGPASGFASTFQWDADLVDIVMESGKLRVLVELLGTLKHEGHRVLIFSQSKKMLDLIEHVLTCPALKYRLLRIDGSVKAHERQARIDQFNNNLDYFVFLLTTKAGGEGVNLTGADRVIIFDPHWNPSADAQVCTIVPHVCIVLTDLTCHCFISFVFINHHRHRISPHLSSSPFTGCRPQLPHRPAPPCGGVQAHHVRYHRGGHLPQAGLQTGTH
jgi:SNF2 family DNA or RNA helicase